MTFGMILLRVVLGLALAAHGSQKLFGLFGGSGPTGTRKFFAGLGFRTPLVMAFVALVVLRTSLQFPSAGFVIVTAPATVGFQVTQAICTP